jgi:hypothetical protein
MPRPLKRVILGASTILLSKDIDKYAFMCGSNFNETDVIKNVNQFLINRATYSIKDKILLEVCKGEF